MAIPGKAATVGAFEYNEWRENWPVVLSSMFGIALLTIYVYSTGIMIKPLEEEFGWTRGADIIGADDSRGYRLSRRPIHGRSN